MKVYELIKALSEMPPDGEVVMLLPYEGDYVTPGSVRPLWIKASLNTQAGAFTTTDGRPIVTMDDIRAVECVFRPFAEMS